MEVDRFKEEHPDIVLFSNFDYSDALVATTVDERAVYDYDLMVEWLVKNQDFSVEEAIEWIDYNTIRSLPYLGEKAPIIINMLKEW